MKKRTLISCTQPDGGIVSTVYARDPLASLGAPRLGVAVYIGDACEASSTVIVIEEFLPSRFVTHYTGNINFSVSFWCVQICSWWGERLFFARVSEFSQHFVLGADIFD